MNHVVVINSDAMGRGDDELGGRLLVKFLHQLAGLPTHPDAIVFYNRGVKLLGPGSVVLDTLAPLVKAGSWDDAAAWCCQRDGPFSNMAYVYLQNVRKPREVREDLLRREGLIIVGYLDRGLRRLAMLSQVSTLLGLLGTFHVMIMRVASGQMGGASGLPTSSVWECFLTTMYGLMIAIPCSITYQLLEERLDDVTRELDILVSQLEEWRRCAEDGPG